MNARCPDAARILALVEGRLAPQRAADVEAHLDGCASCRRQLEEVQALGSALAELARAERHAAPAPAWAGLAARLERPGLLDRLPAGVAAGIRQSASLLQPAAAGGLAAALAGLGLGTWLAFELEPRSATSVTAAPYEVSSLLADDAGGIAESYFTLAGDAAPEGIGAELPLGPTGRSAQDSNDAPSGSPGDAGAADSGGAVR